MTTADRDATSGQSGATMKFAVAIVSIVVVAFGVIWFANRGDGAQSLDLVVTDPVGDCREVGGDLSVGKAQGGSTEPIVCGAGVDVLETQVTLTDDELIVTARLATEPAPVDGQIWRFQVFIDANDGNICGLSNESENGEVQAAISSYTINPTTRAWSDEPCGGAVDGATATLTLSLDRPLDASVRVIGATHFSRPDEGLPDESEDDIIVTLDPTEEDAE
jgi:hypothetical protein